MNYKKELLDNIDKIHTTELGIGRIKKNLNLETNDVVKICVELIKYEKRKEKKKGKNYYIIINNKELTVNSSKKK